MESGTNNSIKFLINKIAMVTLGVMTVIFGIFHILMGVHYFREIDWDYVLVEVLGGGLIIVLGYFSLKKNMWAFLVLAVGYSVQGIRVLLGIEQSDSLLELKLIKAVMCFVPILFLFFEFAVWRLKKAR